MFSLSWSKESPFKIRSLIFCIFVIAFFSGCAIFHWDIHAPGILSNSFYQKVNSDNYRIALYLPDSLLHYESTDRGGKFADPQTYHVGEALAPMTVEAFQHAFSELVLLEASPTKEILQRYQISKLIVPEIKSFNNQVSIKGQGVQLQTFVIVYDSQLQFEVHYEASGTSEAQKVFSKKGGPEVNLNAAIENNLLATVQFLQDYLRTS